MENAENQPSKANQPLAYSIEFEPEKPKAALPKCIADYSSKPVPSPKQLQEKQEHAFLRKKVNS